MQNSELKVLKSEKEIRERVAQMGAALTEKFKGKEPVAICVLNGSFVFYSDLIRAIDLDLTCEFLGVSSYQDKLVSSGEVRLTLDLDVPLEGRDVILIEDLVDTGLTMSFLVETLRARKPKSLTSVVLLQKTPCLKIKSVTDMIGFETEGEFAVGYGIDHAGFYRNLPYLAIIPD